ncbi:hypothetical protein D083_0974 [Dickeya solani RNS 08.23.3.1.A]|nr:hypothetical protein D083_0974 [Dickeya solani RNS 08.23.3.1.A]
MDAFAQRFAAPPLARKSRSELLPEMKQGVCQPVRYPCSLTAH